MNFLNLMYREEALHLMPFIHLVLYYLLVARLYMARNIYEIKRYLCLGKYLHRLFTCLFVAYIFQTVQSNMIGGNITILYINFGRNEMSSSGERLSDYANSPTILGGPVQSIFQLFILIFQLAIVWTKKK